MILHGRLKVNVVFTHTHTHTLLYTYRSMCKTMFVTFPSKLWPTVDIWLSRTHTFLFIRQETLAGLVGTFWPRRNNKTAFNVGASDIYTLKRVEARMKCRFDVTPNSLKKVWSNEPKATDWTRILEVWLSGCSSPLSVTWEGSGLKISSSYFNV